MDIDELQDFINVLEDLATYYNDPVDEKKFSESIKDVKKLFNVAKLDIPREIKMTRRSRDYRSELQKFGGYQERRERIKETLYPLMEYLEGKIDISKQVSVFDQGKLNDYLRSNNFTIKTIYGDITGISITETQAGGNGVVYFGKINNHDIAVKILLKNDERKRNRFLCEFFNILVGVDDNEGVVKQYFYDEVLMDGCKLPIIVMKKYPNHLEYTDKMTQDELISKFSQLAKALRKIHNNGIIHRDLKPKNILVDENGRLNIADFGISYYSPDIYGMTGHTKESERLANYEFSAPEQNDSKKELTESADIYSLGQIMYWLVFDRTCKGTRRKKITEKYSGHRMELLDSIIDKCIADDPKDRFQSIDEIYKYISNNKKGISSVDGTKKIEKDEGEIKERLKDIVNNITSIVVKDEYGDEHNVSTFETICDFTDEQITKFLNNIERKGHELLFYDEVVISDFFENCDGMFLTEQPIDRKYFSDLYKMYKEISDNEKLYLPFVKYITKSFNKNCVGVPF